MNKSELATAIIAIFWIVYAIAATCALYLAFDPLKRELLAILGGSALVLGIASAWLMRASRPVPPTDDRS